MPSARAAFESLMQSGRITELTAPEDRVGGYSGQVLLAKDYLRALRLRRPAAAALDGCSPRWTRSRRRPCPPWPGRSIAPFDKVYPDFPGGASIGGPANLCGVPGLFLTNGSGEAGLPTSLQLTGRALSGAYAARDRRALSGAHRASSPASPGIVTYARPALYLGSPKGTTSAGS